MGFLGKEQVLLQARVINRVSTSTAVAMALAVSAGCDVKSFLDPSEMFPDTNKPLQKPILSSLSSIDPSIDDPSVDFYNAVDVKPIDLQVVSQDYKIGKGDLVTITVNDLVGLGVETTKQTRVSESGNISMPLLGQLKAEGLTEDDLQNAIAAAYRNGQIITNAQVSVTVAEARARTFSALGSVLQPGQYQILQADFRLLDALVLTKDVAQGVDTVYVVRQLSEDPAPAGTAPARPAYTPPAPTGRPATPGSPAAPVDPLAPRGDAGTTTDHVAMLQVSDPLAPGRSGGSGNGFQFAAPSGPVDTRTIRVNLEALRNGEFKYNIVIRPHDLIIAPNPVFGEYYMGGHVARTGVYSLTSRKITLKQAIISAGMFDGLAIPERTELVRRIGDSREAFVRIDSNAIFSGNQPDIFLKPNDVIQVGTNLFAPLLSAIRGGFRVTYGFGLLYDRNFAPQQNNT